MRGRVLLDNMNIPAGNQSGGDLEIGHDGDLYVTVGDGGTNPRGSRPWAAHDEATPTAIAKTRGARYL